MVRDSAGVRIVENAEAAPARWRVAADAAVVIGSVSGTPETLLSGVFHGALLEDGSIVIGNSHPVEARLYAPDGGYVRSFGRSGEGPGEFGDGISQITILAGDTVALRNGRLNVHLYSRAGTYARSIMGPVQAGTFAPGVSWIGGWRFLLSRGVLRGRQANADIGSFRHPHRYTIWSSQDPAEDTIAVAPGSGQFRIEPRVTTLKIPFGTDTEVVGCGGLVVIGDSQHYSISAYELDGTLRTIIRKPGARLRTSAADREAGRRMILEGPLFDPRLPIPPDAMRTLRRQAEAVPIPDSHPAFEELICDAQGELWVRLPAHVDAPTVEWDVFSPDGVLRATAVMPNTERVLYIGIDHVLAVVENELDVEFVHKYALRR